VSVKKARGRGRQRGRNRLGRSRHLEKHEAKVDQAAEMRLNAEGPGRRKDWGNPLPPCIGCGCTRRERRKYFRGSWGWALLCARCWDERGRPLEGKVRAEAAEAKAKQKAEKEAERKRAIDAGERPW